MVNDTLEETIKELQRKIENDEEQTYSKTVIREYRNPTYFGVLKQPDAVGTIKGPCGDTMKIYLKIRGKIIMEGKFWTDGCGATLASGNMLLKMIKGKSLQEANTITDTKLIEALESLPSEHHHCALLAVTTLRTAIKNYEIV
ncbi:MAG: iron-sulfur cluster assembly scaffold protein [Thermoplasmata archaeon M11B2D]|nr:MAG: iron-sulfur cluster assembly scaffold protein [Thermoplasmata archaeon M11B2D]PNX53541.1 MAG: iron-sulfur cluster assembly scaffold protein [Thermoplasmata archaeon M9B2D]